MRLTEKVWGIIYLLSGIFAFIISIWTLPIFYGRARLALFSAYVIFTFILGLIFSFLFIRLSVKSFRFAREGLDGDESTNRLSKIIVWVSNFIQVYMIVTAIDYILYW